MTHKEEDTNKERIIALEKRMQELEAAQQKPEEPTQNAIHQTINRDTMHCPTCQKNVVTEKDYSLGLCILLLFFGILFGVLYYILSNKVRCPTCKTSEPYLQIPKPETTDKRRTHNNLEEYNNQTVTEITEKVSVLWYLAPIFFGVIGGLLGYVNKKERNYTVAARILLIGLVITFLEFVIVVLILHL